jgi:hypothetical protein
MALARCWDALYVAGDAYEVAQEMILDVSPTLVVCSTTKKRAAVVVGGKPCSTGSAPVSTKPFIIRASVTGVHDMHDDNQSSVIFVRYRLEKPILKPCDEPYRFQYHFSSSTDNGLPSYCFCKRIPCKSLVCNVRRLPVSPIWPAVKIVSNGTYLWTAYFDTLM